MIMAVRERIYLTPSKLEEREMAILNDRHIERYAMVRQWCWGRVIDFGCGCGYGSYMISRNPDVTHVTGIDISREALNFANDNYASERVAFFDTEGQWITPADTLVALEIMEHLEEEYAIERIANLTGAKDVIVSYPSKKTTHYNPHHFHDFTKEDMHRIWEGTGRWKIVEFIELYREHMVVRITRR
jgi:SAM-dependent methyltransferase